MASPNAFLTPDIYTLKDETAPPPPLPPLPAAPRWGCVLTTAHFLSAPALVSRGHCVTKNHKPGSKRRIHPLHSQGQSLRSRRGQGSLQGRALPASSSSRGIQMTSAGDSITPVSASVLTWPLPCVLSPISCEDVCPWIEVPPLSG